MRQKYTLLFSASQEKSPADLPRHPVDFPGRGPYDGSMGKARKKGDWALLSAFLAFFLPAALIGFLAMGMVADQKKIRENELRDSWDREVARVARELEAKIGERTEALFARVTAHFTPRSDRPAFLAALKGLFLEDRGVSYPFLFSRSGEMVLPDFGHPGRAASGGWMKKWDPPVADPLWLRAQHSEFSGKDPLAAVPLYLALEKRLSCSMLPDGRGSLPGNQATRSSNSICLHRDNKTSHNRHVQYPEGKLYIPTDQSGDYRPGWNSGRH